MISRSFSVGLQPEAGMTSKNGEKLVKMFQLVNKVFVFELLPLYFCAAAKKKEVKKETGLGLTFKKDENFGEWYSEVIVLIIYEVKF